LGLFIVQHATLEPSKLRSVAQLRLSDMFCVRNFRTFDNDSIWSIPAHDPILFKLETT
jgi:hypothetical protein